MKKQTFVAALLSVLTICAWVGSTFAAPTSQTITLEAGWNAVFLEVQPASTDPADVFASVPDLQSVWRWNANISTVEFIQDPDELTPEQLQWLVYYPGDPVLTNLHAIHGETAYLIQRGDGADPVDWMVTGEPTVPHIDWKANSFNFVGFHLNEGGEPLFADFFSSSLAHYGQDIYVLDNTTGNWVEKSSDPSAPMKAGEAFWIYCKGGSDFQGPLSVELDQSTGLHYGTTLVEQHLGITNASWNQKTVTVSVPGGGGPLRYWNFDPGNNIAEWAELPSTVSIAGMSPGGSMNVESLRLGVYRAGLVPDTTYEANVEISDGEGTRIVLPASVTGSDFSGLWVGNATLTKVSESRVDPEVPVDAGSEFSFRLIVHVGSSGQANLLGEVVQLWQDGTWKEDPENPGTFIPDQPGRFVLIANESLLGQYAGAALRDGQPVGRRVSSAAFGFDGPEPMTGSFADLGELATSITLDALDPTNPFRHQYHKDHKSPEQSYEVTRDITLEFGSYDGDGDLITGVPLLSWGSTDVGGIYKETMVFSGVEREGHTPYYEVTVEGTFLLHRVSNAAELIW